MEAEVVIDRVLCLQTFFQENKSQKELNVLKELSLGHFRHDNLCAVLDICVDRAPVLSWRGMHVVT